MNYSGKIVLILCLIIFSSCVKEIDITEFTDEYGSFEQELRVEALMLPQDKTAIIRIDKTIAIDDETLFDCEDDNGNWIGSGCRCGDDKEESEEEICPEDINDCGSVGGLWTIHGTYPYIEEYCDISVIEEANCLSEIFDLMWSIIDDVGEDGMLGDPEDEDEDGDFDEPSSGEGNNVPDCGEPNVDDLEEITESGLIHENDCSQVYITYNNNDTCYFAYSESAGTIYEGAGLLEFSDGSGCQEGEILFDGSELSDFYYDYGAWIPNDCSEDFFTHYENGSYRLFIQCGDKIITSKEPETIPYPVVFVDESDLNMDEVGSCIDEANIYECLNDFEIDNLEYTLGEENRLKYVSTDILYYDIQYFDPYKGCFNGNEPSWTYYHGHPAGAYPPSEETNHFPPGNDPIIFTNEEIVVSSTDEDIGCYQYRMFTFSEGYSNYYFWSQLDLKDPVRSNLREGQDGSGEVVIGGFGAMSGETISFKVLINSN